MDKEIAARKKPQGEGETPIRDNWPELVGLTAEEAEKRIKEENPGLRFQVVGPDCMVTSDFRLDRVWIFVDSDGKVTRTPMIG